MYSTQYMEQELWSASAAARLSGWSVYMLDYLARSDVLLPAVPARAQRQHGRPRKYLFGDIVVLCALHQLTSRGVSVLRLRPSLKAIRPVHAKITASKIPARYLLTSGDTVSLVSARRLSSELTNHGKAAILLDLHALRGELLETIKSDPPRARP